MHTKNEQGESKRKRRRGLLADELAGCARCSRYKARQAIEVLRHANDELTPFVTEGELSLADAHKLVKLAPELIPYIGSGHLKPAECLQALREIREAEPQDFETQVECSFIRWLTRWPKVKREQVLGIIVNAWFSDS